MKNLKNRILIADDYQSIRETVESFCNHVHPTYEISTYDGAKSLKQELDKNPSDVALIITDNDNPGSNEGLGFIKEFSQKIKTPIILMSGYDKKIEALEAGAYGFLSKPFKLDEFKEITQKALENRF